MSGPFAFHVGRNLLPKLLPFVNGWLGDHHGKLGGPRRSALRPEG